VDFAGWVCCLPAADDDRWKTPSTLSAATPRPNSVSFLAVPRAETVVSVAFCTPGELVTLSKVEHAPKMCAHASLVPLYFFSSLSPVLGGRFSLEASAQRLSDKGVSVPETEVPYPSAQG